MNINITSGDCSGALIRRANVPGEVFVWHDVLYDGPLRSGGLLSKDEMQKRAEYLADHTGGGLTIEQIFHGLKEGYAKLLELNSYDEIIFWFDACLFDLSMLAHLLACTPNVARDRCKLICINQFEGIHPFNGLGQLKPKQMKSLITLQQLVTKEQFEFAEFVDSAFAKQDDDLFEKIIRYKNPPLPYFDKAVERWLEEKPSGVLGLGKLERLILDSLDNGLSKPGKIFEYVANHDSIPQYWGDTTLWQKINGLSDRGLVTITGPASKLPQWVNSEYNLSDFVISKI